MHNWTSFLTELLLIFLSEISSFNIDKEKYGTEFLRDVFVVIRLLSVPEPFFHNPGPVKFRPVSDSD